MNLSLPYLYICTFAYFLSEQIPAHTNSISLQFLLTLSLHYANTHLRFLRIKSRMLDVYYQILVDMIYPTFFHEKCYTDAYVIPHQAQKFFSPIYTYPKSCREISFSEGKWSRLGTITPAIIFHTKIRVRSTSICVKIIAVKSPEGVLEEHRSIGTKIGVKLYIEHDTQNGTQCSYDILCMIFFFGWQRRVAHRARSSRFLAYAREPFLLPPNPSLAVDSPFRKGESYSENSRYVCWDFSTSLFSLYFSTFFDDM